MAAEAIPKLSTKFNKSRSGVSQAKSVAKKHRTPDGGRGDPLFALNPNQSRGGVFWVEPISNRNTEPPPH